MKKVSQPMHLYKLYSFFSGIDIFFSKSLLNMLIRSQHLVPPATFTPFPPPDNKEASHGVNMLIKVLQKTGSRHLKDWKLASRSDEVIQKVILLKTVRQYIYCRKDIILLKHQFFIGHNFLT
jgi:hypothetical protein